MVVDEKFGKPTYNSPSSMAMTSIFFQWNAIPGSPGSLLSWSSLSKEAVISHQCEGVVALLIKYLWSATSQWHENADLTGDKRLYLERVAFWCTSIYLWPSSRSKQDVWCCWEAEPAFNSTIMSCLAQKTHKFHIPSFGMRCTKGERWGEMEGKSEAFWHQGGVQGTWESR